MENIKFTALSQIYEKHLPNGNISIFVKQNNFKAGEIDPSTSTFTSVRRSSKNIMKMFKALGINEEILTHYDFEYLIIPFNGSFLRTYRKKWLQEGIRSPWCNESVDSQILLPLDKINMHGYEPVEATNEQLTLFAEVTNE